MSIDLHAPFRSSVDAHRLEAMGFCLAEQHLTNDAVIREGCDSAFRSDLRPVRRFLRPHVFAHRTAREAACRSPMPGGVFALEPVRAEAVRFSWPDPCLFAIGHGIDDPGFEDVAPALVDPEMAALVERATCEDGRRARTTDSVVLTVFGAHYQCLVQEEGKVEVRGKAPFGVVPGDEVADTAAWLAERLAAILELRRGSQERGRRSRRSRDPRAGS